MNIWSFTGNLGKDAEVGYSQNQKPYCRFSVGVSSGFGDNRKTTWANCILFGKRAEGGLVQYLTKGQQVAVSGELTLDKWQGNDGQERQALKVVVGEIDLIGGQGAQRPQQGTASPSAASYQAASEGPEFGDDSIPF